MLYSASAVHSRWLRLTRCDCLRRLRPSVVNARTGGMTAAQGISEDSCGFGTDPVGARVDASGATNERGENGLDRCPIVSARHLVPTSSHASECFVAETNCGGELASSRIVFRSGCVFVRDELSIPMFNFVEREQEEVGFGSVSLFLLDRDVRDGCPSSSIASIYFVTTHSRGHLVLLSARASVPQEICWFS